MARLNDGRIAVSVPRFDSAYSSSAIVALFSADGVADTVVSDASFVASLGVGTTKWDYMDHLIVRNDGSLCGRLGSRIVQVLPDRRFLVAASSAISRLSASATGDILESGGTVYPAVNRPNIRRLAANGTVSWSHINGAVDTPAQPDISVYSSGGLYDGQTVNFGSVSANAPLTLGFTISNLGTALLSGLSMNIDGANASDFRATSLASTSIGTGGSISFSVTFTPSAFALRSAGLHIVSNDPDESPFDIYLTGTGGVGQPEIDVQSGGTLQDGGTLDVGSAIPGGIGITRSILIQNIGQSTLTGLAITIDGANASEFQTSSLSRAALGTLNSVGVVLTFTPLGFGQRTAVLHIASNDTDENPFDIFLTGTGSFPAPKFDVLDMNLRPLSSNVPRGVVAWGSSNFGETRVPVGLSQVRSLAAGGFVTIAATEAGKVFAWGKNDQGQARIPADLTNVVQVATGGNHCLALTRSGTVVAWGANGVGQCKVPLGLTGVVKIAASAYASVALKQDGTVVTWGAAAWGGVAPLMGKCSTIDAFGALAAAVDLNGKPSVWGTSFYDQTLIPSALGIVGDIQVGGFVTATRTEQGQLGSWGSDYAGQISQGKGRFGVKQLDVGGGHSVALMKSGRVTAWGRNVFGESNVPSKLQNVKAVAAGEYHSAAITDSAGLSFSPQSLGEIERRYLSIHNTGNATLDVSKVIITGADASQFIYSDGSSMSIPPGSSRWISVLFSPTRVGKMEGQLLIYSNTGTPVPFGISLEGIASWEVAASSVIQGGEGFTFGPLATDATTGAVVQKLSFSNTTRYRLNGLRLVVSGLASGITLASSSLGEEPGTLEVTYSKAMESGETVQLTLCYLDPKRRTSASIQPRIRAIAVETAEARSGTRRGNHRSC